MEKRKKTFKERIRSTTVATWIFRGILALLLIAATVAAFIVYDFLGEYLMGYENARPEYVAEEYFQKLFSSGDYGLLYDELELDENGPVSREEFCLWFKRRVGDGKITYQEVSAGLSEKSKYHICIDGEKIGEFVLAPSGEKNAEGFDVYVKEDITILWTTGDAFVIRVQKGSEVYVNGALLNEEYITESGSLINGEYEIYTVNGLYNEPQITVKLNGEECYITKTLTERVYTDEVFGDNPEVAATTVRVVKGHTVWADGERITDDCLVSEASGHIDGFYRGSDKLEYLVYSIPAKVSDLKILDENGKEVSYSKIAGGEIYSEDAIQKKGTVELYVLSGSKLYLSGSNVTGRYIVESGIMTESCEYMPEGVQGNVYNKYSISWVGEYPECRIVNHYGVDASFSRSLEFGGDENEPPFVESPYDDMLRGLFSAQLLNISKMYSKMMIRYEDKSKVLSHFEVDSDGYKQIKAISTSSLSKPASYSITGDKTYDFCKYSDNVYSGKVSYEVRTVKYSVAQTLKFSYTFYFKYVDGEILIFNMANNGN